MLIGEGIVQLSSITSSASGFVAVIGEVSTNLSITAAGEGARGSKGQSISTLQSITTSIQGTIPVTTTNAELNVGLITANGVGHSTVSSTFAELRINPITAKGIDFLIERIPQFFGDVYEISNARTSTIKTIPDVYYHPFRVEDSRYNVRGERIKSGTISVDFLLETDIHRLKAINIFITSSGITILKKSLVDPSRYLVNKRIPIHLSAKINDLIDLEFVYETETGELEPYVVPVNVDYADYSFINASTENCLSMKSNFTATSIESVQILKITIAEQDSFYSPTIRTKKSILIDTIGRVKIDETENLTLFGHTISSFVGVVTDNLGRIQIGG